MQHEAADLHVTGLALYTDDLVNRHVGVLHAYPVQATHTHAHVTSLRTEPALECRVWCACSPRPTCPA
jgi:xanthine dehydrogenase large subunit